MKKSSRFIAVLLGCFMMCPLFAACTPTNPDTDKDPPTGNTTEDPDKENPNNPDNPNTPNNPDNPNTPNNPNNPDNPDNPDDPLPDYPYDEDEAKLYDYKAKITTEMPAVYINTADGKNNFATDYNRDSKLQGLIEYTDATVTVSNCESEYEMADIAAQVKVRGNYTLEYEKKPLRIKFNKKQNMLGLNEGQKFKNWVLLADWKDLSATQNAVAFYLGHNILGSDGYYTSDFRNVEVYLNNQYWGVYLLAEQQEVKDGRTSVSEVDDNYTGTDVGYFFEYDGYYTDERNMPDGGDPTFEVDYANSGRFTGLDGGQKRAGCKGYTMKSDIYDDAQLNFIKNYTQNVYRIAYEAAYNNAYYKFNDSYTSVSRTTEYESAKEAISAVIDVQSLVDMYILQEIACDPDIAWSSFFLSVDMSANGSKKLIFEAPWDFDSAFGIRSGFVNSGTGMYAANSDNPWLVVLIRQSWFQDMIKEKWEKLNAYGVIKNTFSLITEQKETYATYFTNSLNKWKNRVTYGNGELTWELNSYTTQGQAADYLYKWLYTRLNYLSKQWSDGRDVLTDTSPVKVDETIPAGSTAYKFEAESAQFGGGLDSSSIRDNRDYASGGAYVGNLSGAVGRTLTFRVNSASDTTAYLFASVSKRAMEADFSDWFTVTVNGTPVTIPYRNVEGISGNEEEWHVFISVKLAPVQLKSGSNTIVFTTGSDSSNFDCIEIYSTAKLS